MTLRVRQWRKRQRELDQLLCYSGSDEEGIENNCNSVSGTQSSFSSDGVPGTPDSLMSDSVLGTSDDFDLTLMWTIALLTLNRNQMKLK